MARAPYGTSGLDETLTEGASNGPFKKLRSFSTVSSGPFKKLRHDIERGSFSEGASGPFNKLRHDMQRGSFS